METSEIWVEMVELKKKGSFYLLYSESPSGTEKADSKLAHASQNRGCHSREPSPVKATLRGSQINFAPEANLALTVFGFSFLAIPVLPAYFFLNSACKYFLNNTGF